MPEQKIDKAHRKNHSLMLTLAHVTRFVITMGNISSVHLNNASSLLNLVNRLHLRLSSFLTYQCKLPHSHWSRARGRAYKKWLLSPTTKTINHLQSTQSSQARYGVGYGTREVVMGQRPVACRKDMVVKIHLKIHSVGMVMHCDYHAGLGVQSTTSRTTLYM